MKRILQIKDRIAIRARFSGFLALARVLLSCLAGCATGAKTAQDCGPWQQSYPGLAQKFLKSELAGHDNTELHPEDPQLGHIRRKRYEGYAWKLKIWVREKNGPNDYSRPKAIIGFSSRRETWFSVSNRLKSPTKSGIGCSLLVGRLIPPPTV